MNLGKRLRRLRIAFAVQFAIVAALGAAIPVNMALHRGAGRIDDRLETDLLRQMDDVLLQHRKNGANPEDSPSWWVDVPNRSSEAFSETSLEPPLFNLMTAAGEGEAWDEFQQGGSNYVAYARAIEPQRGYVTIVATSGYEDDKSSLQARLLMAVLAATALAGAAGWFFASRALGPARQALADQQGFLADAAHELRTPLAVILASASQALGRSRSSEEYVRSLSEIRSASERASAGVTQLLDLARFDSGQVIPRTAPLRLDLLAEEVAASIRPDGCVISAEPSPAVVVDADMALLRQALDNLVTNAARRAGNVQLVTRIDGRDGVLDVLDDGPGFDPTVLPHVFDRHRRGDTRGNAGLGLAIVNAIVAAHGGAAEAANRPEGGACVRLRIPMSTAHGGS
ncbi:MAG: sensor histidine kinase [Acidimicrobiia bacterium]